MIPAISISLSARAQALLARAAAAPAALGPLLIAAIDEQNELTTGYIMADHLTGTGPFPVDQHRLGTRSNRLRGSARPTKAVSLGNTIYSSIGTNVVYAGAHEYGLHGVVQVKEHKRRIIALDRYVKKGRGWEQTQSGIRGRIRAHSMRMNIPARAPFRTGIEERIPNYQRALSAAISAAYRT